MIRSENSSPVEFAAYRYHTTNLGDEIQTLAAMQFLPQVDRWIDRDWVGRPRLARRIALISNGWFLHNVAAVWGNRSHQILRERFGDAAWLPAYLRVVQKMLWKLPYAWPPAPSIEPLFVSFHVADVGRAVEVITRPDSIEYLRRHEPIGCRDHATTELLREAGANAYFSGCLTTTLRRPEVERTGEIVVTDVGNITHPEVPELSPLPRAVKQRLIFLTHYSRALNPQWRLARARELLRRYAAARLVITGRLHCALPCAAMGTPVLFVVGDTHDSRFGGLLPYMNTCRPGELKQRLAGIDWNAPVALPNPKSLAPLAEPLSARCTAFVSTFETP